MDATKGRPSYLTNEAIRAIYAGFQNKDMTYENFAKELIDLFDPEKAMLDLGNMEMQKARQRSAKARIDRAVQRNN